jgi:hypothetical protein
MNSNVGCWVGVVALEYDEVASGLVAVGYDEVIGGGGEDAECSGEDFTLETVT